ncbi:MAG: hypothetical protein K2Q12_06250 [Rickettsiales bacterium]|nr:hypothetical protein [Rickettsiales bacterium]
MPFGDFDQDYEDNRRGGYRRDSYTRGYEGGNGQQSRNHSHDQSTKILGGLVDVGDSNLAQFVNLGEELLGKEGIRRLETWNQSQAIGKTFASGNSLASKLGTKLGIGRGPAALMITSAIRGIPAFYRPIITAGKSLGQYGADLKKLAKDLEPVLTAQQKSTSIVGLLSGDIAANEVVQVAKQRARAGLSSNLLQNMLAIPQGLLKMAAGIYSAKQDKKRLDNGQPATPDMLEQFVGNGTPLLGSGLENFLKKRIASATDMTEKPIALDWIIHLDKFVKASPGENTIQLPRQSNEVPMQKYVKEVFLLHQRNKGEPEIGRKNAEKLDYACTKIGEMIRSGKLSAWALMGLVGNREIIMPDGQVAGQSAVDKAIDKHRALMPAHFSVDVNQYFEDSLSTTEDMKGLLESLKDKSRDLYVLTHPQDVMEKIGVSKADYAEAEHRLARFYPEMLWQATQDLGTMSDKELRKVGFESREISLLRRVADETRDEPHASVLHHVSSHGQYKEGIEFIVAQHSDYWRSVANGESKVGDLFKKAKRQEREGDEAEHDASAANAAETPELRRESGRRSRRAAPRSRDMAEDMETEADTSLPASHLQDRMGREHFGRVSREPSLERDWAN